MKRIHIKSDYSNDYRISWFPTLTCNFKCSYCFSKNSNKFFDKEKFFIFKDILNEFAENYPHRIVLQILGGEPTLIKDFDFYLNMLDKKIFIELVTNASQDLFKFQRVNYFEFSFHPEYFKNKWKKIFLQNLLIPQRKVININLHNDFKNNINFFKKNITEIKEFCYKNNVEIYFNINPLTVYKNEKDNLDIKWFTEELKLSKKDFEKENFYYLNKQKINILDHLELYNNLNCNFKNCWCKMNAFILDYDYNLSYNCSGGNNFEKINLLKDKKFLKLQFWNCKSNRCDPSCYLDCEKILKIKDNIFKNIIKKDKK